MASSKWGEIRNDYKESDSNIIFIDAWITADDDEEGKSIAKVHPDGTVEYIDEVAKTDEYAQEMINEAIKMQKDAQ